MTLAPGLLAAAIQVLPPDSAILRGTIVAAGSDAPLPLTIVELSAPPAQRFADHDGTFSFTGLRPGTYHLRRSACRPLRSPAKRMRPPGPAESGIQS